MDLAKFTDVLGDDSGEIENSQPLSLSLTPAAEIPSCQNRIDTCKRNERPARGTGQQGEFRCVEEIEPKYRDVFSYPYFNLVQSSVLDDALYSDKSMVVCAPTGSGKTVVFEMAIVQLLMELDDKNYTGDFKIIYMAPVKALCTERLSEWYPKFTKLGLMCIEVTGDTEVDFSQLKPYRIIITTPEKWDMLTRRWRDHRSLVEVIKLFLIDEVHILNDDTRGPVLEAVVSRMKTIESSSQSAHRIEQLQKQYQTNQDNGNEHSTNQGNMPVRIRFVAVSATVSNPEDVAAWLGTRDKPAVYYKFGDECRPVKLRRVVEGYPCSEGTSIFKFDIILNYKLWPVIQKYHDGKSTLIFCNTRKSVAMTAEMLSRELTVSFTPEQQARLAALASTIKNKKLQALVLSGVGCHHAGLLFEERLNIEEAFRNRELPILITTTTLAMGVNLPAHLVIIKNTQQYVNGAYQEYSISTVLQMVGRAGRPQYDTEATAVIMTRLQDKSRYQALVGGDEPLQSYLHKRMAENLNSEAALGTVCDVAQCVQWLRSTFLSVRAAKDPKRYLGLPQNAQPALISKKIEELCVKAMNGLASSGLITMDEASCIESTEAGRLMSIYYLDLETMKHIMKIDGSETLEQLLWIVCESHELADMHLRVDERRTLNTLNRNNAAATIRFPMKGKINTRQMKLNCIIQAVLGCLPIPEPSLNQEAMKVIRIAHRVCKCLVAYVTRPDATNQPQPRYFTAIVNALVLAKCIQAHLWENSPYVSKQLKGIGPTFSTLLATAGKVNFALLEESHPRDLERIMNKGAPAGNVLRKQVSLLPKYQLTATPLDEKRISIQLVLLNQHQLADNRDQLTAGDSHKCYVVVGDSENYLLLFTSFKDKDLISIYDGAITFEVTRIHNFEHKVLIHCISSNWVGIDVHCDYLFKNIEPSFLRGEAINPIPIQDTPRKSTKKQTSITDVYKERKRKSNDIDITESKEKKKRDTALLEKFKYLKNSFEATSKEIKDDLDKSAQMSNMIINGMIYPDQNGNINKTILIKPSDNIFMHPAAGCNFVHKDDDGSMCDSKPTSVNNASDFSHMDTIDLDSEDNFVVDDHINSIMNEIETEILKTNNNHPKCANTNMMVSQSAVQEKPMNESPFFTGTTHGSDNAQSSHSSINSFPRLDTYLTTRKSLKEKKKLKSINTKTNYSFIDKIEKSVALDNDIDAPQADSGFSDTIKSQIEKFLQSTAKIKQDDITINGLLSCTEPTENISLHQNTKTFSNIINECPTTKHNISLSLELPAVRVIPDRPQKAAHNQVNTQPEINNQTNKEKENGIKERPFDTLISNKEQHIDRIVEDIEREYNNIMATKESNSEEQVTSTDLEKISDIIKLSKSEGNNFNYSENIKNIKAESNKSDAECCNSKIQSVENKPLVELHKPVKHRGLSLIDRHATKINKDHCSSNNLYTITQYRPSTSNELGDEINQIIQADDNVHYQNQNDICNNKDSVNMPQTILVPRLPVLNSSQNKCKTTASEEAAEKEKADNYINRYSFFATKIDVSTKNLPDYQVQVIRKLRLDLDVTEIVSKVNNNDTANKSQQPTEENKYYRIDRAEYGKPKPQEEFYGASKHLNKNKEIENKEGGKYRNYFPQTEFCINDTGRYLTYVPPTNGSTLKAQKINSNEVKVMKDTDGHEEHCPETKITSTNAGNRLPDVTQSSQSNSIMDTQNFDRNKMSLFETTHHKKNEINDIQTLSPRTEFHTNRQKIEDIEQYKKYLREIAGANAVKSDESGKSILAETEKHYTPQHEDNDISIKTKNINNENINQCINETKSNKVKNILQKYCAILRKNNDILNNTDKNIFSHDFTRPPLEKTKKAYKISDIQNLRIPLPKNLITVEASRTPRPNNDDILTRIRDIENYEDINTSRKNGNTQDAATTGNKSIECFEDKPEGISEYLSHDIGNLQEELTTDFDLDQSMLNPKTLLEQCFSKDEINDEQIIPPPPPSGFWDDENIYSPVKLGDLTSQEYNETQRDFTSKCDHDKSLFEDDYEKQRDLTSEHDNDKSIFEEDNPSVLTPSVEIETWTLSRDDEETDNSYFSKQKHTQRNKYIARENEENTDYFKTQIHSQSSANKSCTVLRRNHSVNRDLPLLQHFEPNSRRGKLGYFKFTHKKKFKM